MPESTIKTPKTDIWKVKFSQLALHDNPRTDIVKLDELALSIKFNGVIEPLSGYRKEGKYVIVNGSRRYYAMEMLFNTDNSDTECLFNIIPRGSSEEDILVRQLTANTGEQLNPLERAMAVKKLQDAGWESKKIANQLGLSQTYIKRLLSLATAPEELINLVKQKTVMATFAMDRIAEGKAKVEEFLATHKDGGFSRYEQEELPLDEPELKSKKEKKQGDITKKDLEVGSGVKIPNSWNEFKKYADKADYLEMWEGKLYSPQEVFQFLLRLKNNEIAWDDIKSYFMATKEKKPSKVNDEFVERQYPT